jgi:hypothetical protein
MPWVIFEPIIRVFEWLKIFHALDCAAAVVSMLVVDCGKLKHLILGVASNDITFIPNFMKIN